MHLEGFEITIKVPWVKVCKTYHSPHTCVPEEVKFAINITDLITRLSCGSEKGDNFPTTILKLEDDKCGRLVGRMVRATYDNVGAVGGWPPSILKTIWT